MTSLLKFQYQQLDPFSMSPDLEKIKTYICCESVVIDLKDKKTDENEWRFLMDKLKIKMNEEERERFDFNKAKKLSIVLK